MGFMVLAQFEENVIEIVLYHLSNYICLHSWGLYVEQMICSTQQLFYRNAVQ